MDDLDVLSYHVFTDSEGGLWLADDEHHWTPNFHSSAAFTNAKLANDIGEREKRPDDTLYVFACMGSM